MEREYKWKFLNTSLEKSIVESGALYGKINNCRLVEMKATYYDTYERTLTSLNGYLRMRNEEQAVICCMKIPKQTDGACMIREEYQAEARDVYDGLFKLPTCGAPAPLCKYLQTKGVHEICKIEYMRKIYYIDYTTGNSSLSAELTFDRGQGIMDNQSIPIFEIEFEFKKGSLELFNNLAFIFANTFNLEKEPLSKMKRVLLH